MKKKRRLLGIVFPLAFVAVLTFIAITLIFGQGQGFSGLTGLFGNRSAAEPAGEYHFDVGRNRVFANLGGSLAAAGSLGIQVLDNSDTETLRDLFRLSSPAIKAAEEWAIAFDIGGTAVRAFTEKRVSASLEAGGAIVSATINKNGWFVVCTQESKAFKSIVTAYDSSGREVYKISLATGYALSAVLSPDNRKLAVLNLTDDGSKITLYSLNSEAPDSEYNYEDGLILEIRNLPDGIILAVATDSLIIVDADGVGTVFFGFDGSRLGGYMLGEDFITLHLLDYGVGYRGRIVTLDDAGRLLGGIVTDREVISMSSGGGYLAILKSDGSMFFDAELNQFQPVEESTTIAGATQVISLGDRLVFAAGDHFAVVFRIGA